MEKSKAVNTSFTSAHAESASGRRNKTRVRIKNRKGKSHAATLLHTVFRNKAGLSVLPCPTPALLHTVFRDKAGLSVLPCPTPALLHAVFRDKVEGRFSE